MFVSLEVTQLGLVLIPVTLMISLFLPGFLLPWTFVLVPFQAASVLNVYVGGYPIGIQPGYFAAAFLIGSLLSQLVTRGYLRIPRSLVFMGLPLLAFAVYASASAALLPRIFEGSVNVFPPREGIMLSSLAPLHPSLTNLSQAAYIVFLAVFTAAVPVDAINSGRRRSPSFYTRSYMAAAYLVVLVGLYQLCATYLSLPYPYELLYSNPAYGAQYGQTLTGGIKRLSSTFTEPAVASFYLVGVFAFSLWHYLFARRSRSVYPLCLLSGAALLLTTSTTAYLAMGTMIRVVVSRNISQRVLRLVYVAVPAAMVTLVSVILFDALDAFGAVATEVLVEKSGSVSYTDRVGTALHSLSLLGSTGGLGVGWGSNRSSSLLFNTLSNAGVWGSLLLAWFGVRVCGRLVRVARSLRKLPKGDQQRLVLIQSFAVSVIAMLVAGTISVADLTIVSFWLNLAVLIALVLDADSDAREARRAAQAHSPALTRVSTSGRSLVEVESGKAVYTRGTKIPPPCDAASKPVDRTTKR